jgi:hypothetical protein
MSAMFSNHNFKKRLEKLIGQWVDYRTLVVTRMGAEDVTPDEERRFLELKGKIAENLAGVAGGMPAGTSQEVHGHQRSLGEFLNRYTNLQVAEPPSPRDREEFEREWHRQYLFLNRLKGVPSPAGKKNHQSRAKPVAVTPTPGLYRGRSFGGWFVKFVVRLALLVVAIWAIVVLVPWERVSGGRAVSGGRVGGFMSDAWGSAKGAAAGLHVPTLGGFFQPVVSRYGPELTAIMVGVLLVAVGYWIFIRMR